MTADSNVSLFPACAYKRFVGFLLLLCHTNCFQHFANTHALTGGDYVVNLDDVESTDFTVTFLSKQANSTEHVINIADDEIFEGREYFRLRITEVRPIDGAAQLFVPQDGVENTFVDISIEDDDGKSSNQSCAIVQLLLMRCYLHLMHCFL